MQQYAIFFCIANCRSLSIPYRRKATKKMATLENERYLRSMLFLTEGGSYIAKKIIQRELLKKGNTLDKLLTDDILESKVKNEFRNKKQREILYPAGASTDVDKWDVQMLSGIVLILFWQDLQPEERKSLREIKRLRIELAHSPSAGFYYEEYKDFVAALEDAVTTLASNFEKSIQDKCREIFDKYKECPLEVTSSVEKLKRLNDSEPLIGKILEGIESSERNIIGEMKKSETRVRSDIQNIALQVQLVSEQLANVISRTKQFQRESIIVNTKLTFSGEEELFVQLADKITVYVFNRVLKKIENHEDNREIELAVNGLLKRFDEMVGVTVLPAVSKCVFIRLRCDTFKDIYDVLKYTSSDIYQQQLTILAEAVDSYIKRAKPFMLCSEITEESLQNIAMLIEADGKKESEPSLLSNENEEIESSFDDDGNFNDSRKVLDIESLQDDEEVNKHDQVPPDSVIQDTEQVLVEDLSHTNGSPAGPNNAEQEKMIVAALDIGSKFTSMAYSTGAEFKRDCLKIQVYQDWTNSTGIQTDHAPTVALFDEENRFHSFGYDFQIDSKIFLPQITDFQLKAEIKYAEILENAEEEATECRWRFFSDLSLEPQQNKEYIIKDDQSQPMHALNIYKEVLVYLKEKMFRYLSQKFINLTADDIKWSLAVPVHENDIRFLQDVSKRTSGHKQRTSFVLIPHAATLYCKELFATDDIDRHCLRSMKWISPGELFVVVDAGYRTFRAAVLKLEEDGSIADLSFEKINHLAWTGAGKLVNENLDGLLNEIFGDQVMERFQADFKLDALELKDTQEIMKRFRQDLENEKDDFITPFKVPSSLLSTFENIKKFKFSERREELRQTVHVPSKGGRIYFSNDTVIDLFKDSKQKLVDRLKDLLKEPDLTDVRTILFVGGLADSEIMRNELKNSFLHMNVIYPNKASTAAVKGAVMYGHTIGCNI